MNKLKISTDEITEIIAAYKNRLSLRQLAIKYGHSIDSIKKILLYNQIELHKQRITIPLKNKLSNDEQQKIIQYYLAPHSLTNTALYFNKSTYIIKQILLQNGIALHKINTLNKIRLHTSLEKYGVPCTLQSEAVKEKRTKSMLEKYGVIYSGESQKLLSKSRATTIERYGVDYYTKTTECKERVKATNNLKYGTNYYTQTDEFKERQRKTNLEKYGYEYYMQSKEFREKSKETCRKKYGVDYSFQSENNKSKALITKRKNGTFTSSKAETDFKEFLIQNNINFKTQYIDKNRYPFHCDFYLTDIDTFIELNLSWVHGGGYFNKDNPSDMSTLQLWRQKAESSDYYKSAIDVWTNRDLNKANFAKTNNLKYIAIFNIKDLEQLKKQLISKK